MELEKDGVQKINEEVLHIVKKIFFMSLLRNIGRGKIRLNCFHKNHQGSRRRAKKIKEKL